MQIRPEVIICAVADHGILDDDVVGVAVPHMDSSVAAGCDMIVFNAIVTAINVNSRIAGGIDCIIAMEVLPMISHPGAST